VATSVLAILDEREDVGVQTCTTCPKLCRWACPVAEAEARESVSPHSLVVLSGLLKSEKVSASTVGAFPYHCTACGACTEACLHKNDVPLWISMERSRVLSAGAAPKQVREVVGHFGVAGNPQGVSLENALSDIVSAARATMSREGATVYLPGCKTIESMPDAATAFLRGTTLLGIAGVSVTSASAACCGLPLWWAGELEGFRAHAIRYAAQFERSQTLVVHDAACAHALLVRYPEVGAELRPRVIHPARFLAENLDLEKRVQSKRYEGPSIAYADTCSLSRGLGLVDEPRRLLRRITGQKPIELEGLGRREVDCCGAAGLLPESTPTTANAMAEAKIQAFRESGADELAVFSPRCAAHLSRVDPTIVVVDGAHLIARL
jgi:Fe-S oxidoreductase